MTTHGTDTMTTAIAQTRRISDHHRSIHAATLALARVHRHDAAKHASLMHLARSSRFYFTQLRALGD